jgi:hypothetical protein
MQRGVDGYLNEYRTLVMQIEQDVLRDPALSITSIYHQLNKV